MKSKSGHQVLNRKDLKDFHAQSLSTNKGMLVIGLPGTGKTTCLRSNRMVTAYKLAMDYQLSGIEAVKASINNMIQYESLKVTIDDLGTETIASNYGQQLDVIPYIIQSIYDINQTAEKPIKLYLTSNLNYEALTARYGMRVTDRLNEMTTVIVLEDTNLRKS